MAQAGRRLAQGRDRDAAGRRGPPRGAAPPQGGPGMGARGHSGRESAGVTLRSAAPRRGAARRPPARLPGSCAALAVAGGCARKGDAGRTVVFWQFSPLASIQPIVARFEAEHPGIHVRVEQLTWQTGREKIVAAVAAGLPPDLCEIGSTFLPGLVADSTLLDLTDSTAALTVDLLGWDIVRSRGRAFALPWLLGTRALYVNTALLRRAGLDPARPPATWAELARAVKRIDALGGGVRGFGMNSVERELLLKRFMPFAWGRAGSVLAPAGTGSVVASSENLEALRFYIGLKPYSLLDRQ